MSRIECPRLIRNDGNVWSPLRHTMIQITFSAESECSTAETRTLVISRHWHFCLPAHRILFDRLEPVTHFLTGACLGRAGLNRKTALATLTLTLAAEAQTSMCSAESAAPLLASPIIAALPTHSSRSTRRGCGRRLRLSHLAHPPPQTEESKPSPRWGLLFVYACIAGLSHILLDFTNNYGVRPFWPFSEKWYSWTSSSSSSPSCSLASCSD